MPILGNRIYRGHIHRAKMEAKDKQDGGVTKYLKLRVQAEQNGFIDTELYFTPDAVARTKKVLAELNPEIWDGTYPFLLRDPEKFLKDRPCKIETEDHVYVNKSGIEERSVRVKWLNGLPEGKSASEDDIATVLAMMGVEDTYVKPEAAPPEEDPAPNGDEPF